MATMIEKKADSIRKEIENLEKRIDRNEALLQKKIVKAEKVGANWSREEFFQHRDTDMTQDQWAAYFDKYCVETEIEDAKHRLENAKKRLSKVLPQVEEAEARKGESNRLDEMEIRFYRASQKSAEEREAEYQEWLRWFKAECLKDGIVIENASGWLVNGTAKSGKRFCMYGNSGNTVRSLHCYTLRVDGETVFTSGDFSTAYRIIKK